MSIPLPRVQVSVHVSRPQVALPGEPIPTEDVVAEIKKAHGGMPGLERYLDAVEAAGVRTRHWAMPLAHVLGRDRRFPEDLDETVRVLDDLAEDAARRALAAAGLEPGDIGCLVVTSVTGWRMPALDVGLINRLGLRPTVRRLIAAQVGCVGTAWGLARAREQVALYPQDSVLVMAAEAFSLGSHRRDGRPDALIFQGLGGDGAAATVVRAAGPDAVGLVLGETWETVLPGTGHYYGNRLDGLGMHFDSTRVALEGAGQMMPRVTQWLDGQWLDNQGLDGVPGGRSVHFALVHPGSSKILATAGEGLGVTEKEMRWSWRSLAEIGNATSASLPHVIAGMYDDPPAPGSRGVLLAFGPGFAAVAGAVEYLG